MSIKILDPFLEEPNNIDKKEFSKKLIFNTMWDRDINGIRILELDAIKNLNSNINNIIALNSPIDGTTTKTIPTLFLVRKRLIKLMDIWNRILNSGLFIELNWSDVKQNSAIKAIGANVRNPITEYFFKANNVVGTYHYPLTLDTVSIFYRIQRFLTAYVNNYNYFILNNLSNSSFFNLTTVNVSFDMIGRINKNFNPLKISSMNLIEELVVIYKELLDESKLISLSDLSFTLNDLTMTTDIGRANILKLDSYKSNYYAVAKFDLSYLNDQTKVLANAWISNSTNLDKLCPQFGTEILRNQENEVWNYKNIIMDLAPFKADLNFSEANLGTDIFKRTSAKKYWIGSMLDMKKPLYFKTQFINYDNSNDQPYIMQYSGSTLVYLPDELKDKTNPIQISENSIDVGSYTISNNYKDLPALPNLCKAIEFTLITDNTSYNNGYARKLIGPASAKASYLNGITLTGGSYNVINYSNSVSWTTATFSNEYKNQNLKIRLENINGNMRITSNNTIIYESAGSFDFTVLWGIGCTDSNRYSSGVQIKDLTYIYNIGSILEKAPDNQLNLSANFWKIGSSNPADSNYNQNDDIKLKLGNQPLSKLDKLDFLDNLTLYLKLNK